MNKLYYTCPLEAAYMAKNFGVKLQGRHSDEQMQEFSIKESERFFDWLEAAPEDGCSVDMVEEALSFLEDAGGAIYIHPESFSIFAPKVGDVIWLQGWNYPQIIEPDDDLPTINEYCRGIIQRNNKPFIMPRTQQNETETKN